MEQNNIEKLVKEAIKDRSVEPSMQARERLITALNSEPKKKKRLWIYYASAAAVLILLYVIGARLQNENLDSEILPEITFQKEEVKTNTHKTKSEDNTFLSEIFNDEVSNQSNIKRSNKIQINKGSLAEIKTRKNVKSITISDSLAQNQLLAYKTNTTKKELENSVVKASNEIDTTSKKMEKAYSFITPERLLAEVETDSSSRMIPSNTPKTFSYVGSDQLLLEMERQLFDEKNRSIFKKAGYELKKVKTAVANRNFKD
jgi:hypothetical protein